MSRPASAVRDAETEANATPAADLPGSVASVEEGSASNSTSSSVPDVVGRLTADALRQYRERSRAQEARSARNADSDLQGSALSPDEDEADGSDVVDRTLVETASLPPVEGEQSASGSRTGSRGRSVASERRAPSSRRSERWMAEAGNETLATPRGESFGLDQVEDDGDEGLEDDDEEDMVVLDPDHVSIL